MLTIAPDDLYPTIDPVTNCVSESPLIGKLFTVQWDYGSTPELRTRMELKEVISIPPAMCGSRRQPLTLVFEKQRFWIVDTFVIEWPDLREMEPEGVKR